jgi:hypothetical protein
MVAVSSALLSRASAQLQASLPLDALQRADLQVVLGVRHGHLAGLGRVAELLVRALLTNLVPAVGAQRLDDLAAGFRHRGAPHVVDKLHNRMLVKRLF